MKLEFSWLNSRKSFLLRTFLDLSIFVLFFFIIFQSSISKISILITINLLNSIIWVISSYVFGRYTNFRGKKLNIFLNQILKTFLNVSVNLLLTQIIFRIFWDWNYMNFESFSNFINYFLNFYKIIFFLSIFFQSTINLYLYKKHSKKAKWLYLGNNLKAINFKNIIGLKTNYTFQNINQEYLIKKSINAKGIVIDEGESFDQKNIQLLFELNNRGIKLMNPSNWCERYLNRYPSELVKVSETIEGKFSYSEFSLKARIKRIFESIISLIILIISSPLILIAAFLIKLEDGGPVFYSQIRNGFQGKEFKMIKLRTMIINAEKDGEQWADKYDKRITGTGNILRKLRIDELPQLVQVITGKMSLIGPRPERPKIDKFLRKNIPNYDLRYSIKPGISGWAQVNYPYGASLEDSRLKLSYDIYYIKNFSILIDFMIFFKTLKLILNGKGSMPIKKKEKSLY